MVAHAFPDLISDLSTVEKAENALSLMLTRTGDPRRAETGVSPLGKVAKSGTYQTRLKNMISFQDFAKRCKYRKISGDCSWLTR